MSLTLVLIAHIPAEGVAAFDAYEAAVLPLLTRHSGELQRRLRTADGTVEVHVVHFASADAFAGFRADPDRAAAQHLLEASGAVTEVHPVADV
ncbi:hypothetical protein GCM10009547_03090 [Sporichthya brevicatena]|uniref:ABM domain-containing protein n=1 Tax=Sporichthya brevicatena TaxID=171442 RepID=A0ABN1G5S1_9ACTN